MPEPLKQPSIVGPHLFTKLDFLNHFSFMETHQGDHHYHTKNVLLGKVKL